MNGIGRRTVRGLVSALSYSALAAAWLASPAAGQSPLFEVENADQKKVMQVNDDGALVMTKPSGDAPLPRLMWHPAKAALRAGSAGTQWDDENIGSHSVALGASTTASGSTSTSLGSLTTASGLTSTAMGSETTASGQTSTAMGITTTASNFASTAMGVSTTASGAASTALGSETKAQGRSSTAMGFRTTAVTDFTTAMGSNAVAFGKGSFVYGDNSTSETVTAAFPDQFVVRASGGFRFRTSPTLSTGCDLPLGSGAFTCTSSRSAKEAFEDIDGEEVLGKLASIPIQRWRYRGTGVAHVGPTAEDFHAAFDLGEGPTTISTVDADGISLLSVQALGRRTAELRAETAALRRQNMDLQRRLEALERSKSSPIP